MMKSLLRLKVMKMFKFDLSEVAIIGDQLFTDILGGNKVGIYTCLVDPLTKEDFILTKIFRMTEQIIFKLMDHKEILKKGEYYE